MTIYLNTAESGTNAATVSTANSGGASGDAWDNVIVGAGAAITYQTAAALRGTMGYRIALGTGVSYLRWDKTEAGSRAVMRRPFKVPTGAAATASITLMQMRNRVAGGVMSNIVMRTDRTIRIQPNAGTELTASASPALTVNTLYWLEMACTKGTDTVTGRVEYKVLNADESSFHSYDTGATVNTLTDDPGQYRFGSFLSTSVTGWTNDEMDDLQAGLVASGWIGPVIGSTDRDWLTWDGSAWV